MTSQKTKTTPTVAISISESPDMPAIGLSYEHLQDAMAEIALHLLSSGLSLAYGGDLRAHGFTELLFELVMRYQNHPNHKEKMITVTNYLAWPVHSRMTKDDLDAFSALHTESIHIIFLTPDGYSLNLEERLKLDQQQDLPVHEPDENERAKGLTAMRNVIQRETKARIVLGGKVDDYRGRMPGIAEETLMSLKSGQPVFLLGGFGGCTRDIAETIGLVDPWTSSHRDWKGRSCFKHYLSSGENLNNGLYEEENKILARTPHIRQAATLVSRGLRRLRNERLI